MPYRGNRDKYFHKPLSVNTIPELKTFFDGLPGKIDETNVRLFANTPDELKSSSLQLALSLMILYFKDLYDREGAEGIEEAFGPLIDQLEDMLWPHMVRRGTTSAARADEVLRETAEVAVGAGSPFNRKNPEGGTAPIRPHPTKKSPD